MTRPATNGSPGRVLVVEDDEGIRDMLKYNLTAAGFSVQEASDGASGLRSARTARPDLILLDLMLPGMSGFDFCRALRKTSRVPIIMITAKDAEVDKIVGLELGADDYVTKPFSPRELAVRVRTVLRRTDQRPATVERLVFDGLELDAGTREVVRDGETLRLTAKEFDLLFFLASNPGQVFSRDQLMHRVWGYSAALDTGTVTVHVRRLRSKIERDPADPAHLQTVWGVGYRFVA